MTWVQSPIFTWWKAKTFILWPPHGHCHVRVCAHECVDTCTQLMQKFWSSCSTSSVLGLQTCATMPTLSDTRDQTRDIVYAKQALYHLDNIFLSLYNSYFCLLRQAGLGLRAVSHSPAMISVLLCLTEFFKLFLLGLKRIHKLKIKLIFKQARQLFPYYNHKIWKSNWNRACEHDSLEFRKPLYSNVSKGIIICRVLKSILPKAECWAVYLWSQHSEDTETKKKKKNLLSLPQTCDQFYYHFIYYCPKTLVHFYHIECEYRCMDDLISTDVYLRPWIMVFNSYLKQEGKGHWRSPLLYVHYTQGGHSSKKDRSQGSWIFKHL